MSQTGRHARSAVGFVGALLAGMLVGAPAATAEISFTQTNYPVTGAPTDLELGDLDHANGADIVVATYTGGSPDSRLVRLLNQGGGAFAPSVATNSCDFGYDLVLHNFSPSSDSNLDALVPCGSLLGDGAGGFAAPVSTGLPIQERSALAEITASGEPELIFGAPGPGPGGSNVISFASWSSGPIFSSPTYGNPPFGMPPVTPPQPPYFPRFSRSGLVPIALDNAPAGDPPREDLVTDSVEGNDKINFYGRDPNPGVNYQAWAFTTRTTSGDHIYGIAPGDLNADGLQDVVVVHGENPGANPRFDVFLWNPATGIPPSAVPAQIPTVARAKEAAVADFDGDGLNDVAVTGGLGELAVHRGTGGGALAAPKLFTTPINDGSAEMAVGDVNGDGRPDIVTATSDPLSGANNVTVFLNGSTAPPVTPPPPPPPGATPDTTAPETTITKAPKAKTSNKKAKFKFTASEAGSSFECKLDKKSYAPCSSPRKYTVDVGKHKFSVRATDPAGNVDPTPAKAKFEVE